jgi:WD40 repeat protein
MDYSLAANHRFGDDLEEVSSMTVSSDTKKLICGFPSGSVKIWNLEDKRCICKVDSIHFGPVTGLGITKDGESLVSCSEDGTVSIWELPSFVLKNNLKGHRGGCQGLTLSRDECYLITFSCREFNVWDIKNI